LRQLKQTLGYVAMAAASFLEVAFLERLAGWLGGDLLRTEIYSIYGFSHIFLGIGLASTVLALRPKSTARVVILTVLLVGVLWELREGLWLRGEPLDSMEDVILSVLSASAFLCFVGRRHDEDRLSSPQ
jgi:hypothetical protein